jgi:hypothetical protein
MHPCQSIKADWEVHKDFAVDFEGNVSSASCIVMSRHIHYYGPP